MTKITTPNTVITTLAIISFFPANYHYSQLANR